MGKAGEDMAQRLLLVQPKLILFVQKYKGKDHFFFSLKLGTIFNKFLIQTKYIYFSRNLGKC